MIPVAALRRAGVATAEHQPSHANPHEGRNYNMKPFVSNRIPARLFVAHDFSPTR